MEVIEGSGQVLIVYKWFSRKTIVLSLVAGLYAYLILRVGSDFFNALKRMIHEKHTGASYLQQILDLSIYDAKALYEELWH